MAFPTDRERGGKRGKREKKKTRERHRLPAFCAASKCPPPKKEEERASARTIFPPLCGEGEEKKGETNLDSPFAGVVGDFPEKEGGEKGKRGAPGCGLAGRYHSD